MRVTSSAWSTANTCHLQFSDLKVCHAFVDFFFFFFRQCQVTRQSFSMGQDAFISNC